MIGSNLFSKFRPVQERNLVGQGLTSEFRNLISFIRNSLGYAAGIVVDEFVAVPSSTSSPDASLLALTPLPATDFVLQSSDLLAAGKSALLALPKRVSIMVGGATPANAPTLPATVTGTDFNGVFTQEQVGLPNTATVVMTRTVWKTIQSIVIPAPAPANGVSISVGFGAVRLLGDTNASAQQVVVPGRDLAQDVLKIAPRRILITNNRAAQMHPQATIVGYSAAGVKMTEVLNTAVTNATTNRCWARIESITFSPAPSGTTTVYSIGISQGIGLCSAIRSRAGYAKPIVEISNGNVVTTGTFSTPVDNPPFGMYTPATPPNDVNSYALYYEADNV